MSELEVRVRFLPHEEEVAVAAGTYLTAAAVRAGVPIVHDCDGLGLCSTCRVEIVEGGDGVPPVAAAERVQLGEAVERGWRLCCLLRVYDDLVVRVPETDFAYPPELQREG